jgi:hypothetical protein
MDSKLNPQLIALMLICPLAISKQVTIENKTACNIIQQSSSAHSTTLDLPYMISPGETNSNGRFDFIQGWVTNPLQNAQTEYLIDCDSNYQSLVIKLSVEKSSQDSMENYLHTFISSNNSSNIMVFPSQPTPLKQTDDILISIHSSEYGYQDIIETTISVPDTD